MALLLHIDTATAIGSVSISKDGKLLQEKMSMQQRGHASVIVPFIEGMIQNLDIEFNQIDAVVISGGPGSYTGLRVATSTAKGLCYAWNLPLIAISTLKMMASGMKAEYSGEEDVVYCPMIDARRQEVFWAMYDADMNEIVAPEAAILEADFLERFGDEKLLIGGTGQRKANEILKNENNLLFSDYECKSSHLIPLAEKAFAEKDFEDVAYFEPFYLKSVYLPNAKKG